MKSEVFTYLPLTIKKQWFDMILSGEKKEEYRDIKPYYDSRFSNIIGYPKEDMHFIFSNSISEPFYVKFNNGYSKDCPSFYAKCTLRIDTGNPAWGAVPNEKYYVLSILEIYKKD